MLRITGSVFFRASFKDGRPNNSVSVSLGLGVLALSLQLRLAQTRCARYGA